MAGDGLVRPLNAPPAGQLAPGVQPGVTPSVIIASRVIVTGPFGRIVITDGSVQFWAPTLDGSPGVAQEPARGWLELNSGLTGTPGDVAAQLNLQSKDASAPGIPLAFLQNGTMLAASQPGSPTVPETWHNVTPPVINGATTGTLRYQLRPTSEVTIECNLSFTALAAQTSVNLFTIPAAYFPTHGINWPMRTFTSTAPVNNEMTGGITSAGVVFANNIPVGGNTIAFYQNYPLD